MRVSNIHMAEYLLGGS